MNLKRIIREEINDFSDSFYLIVSADERFIYRRSPMGGMKWVTVDNLTPKEIVNSDFLTYKAAEGFIGRMEKGIAKVVSMDFILRKRDDNFPMMESNDMEWINDIKSNKDIAEELLNQTVITKDKGIVKLPFTWTRQSPKKPYFDLSIKKKYGKDKDSDDIWERYKVLVNNRLKEITGKGIKESNDMEWINDINPIPEIKIGTCFVDEMSGVLKGGKWVIKSIREKPSVTIIEVVNSKGKSVTLNKKYFEEDLINGRYKGCTESIKESNDMEWVDESMPTLNDALYNRLLKVGDIVTLSGWLVNLDHTSGIKADNLKVKIEKLGSLIDSSDFTPLQKEYWGHLGYMDEPLRFAEEDGDLSVVSIE